MIIGLPKADTKDYVDWFKPCVKALIDGQLQKIKSTKEVMTLWVQWKKSVKLAIILDTKEVKDAPDVMVNTDDNYVRKETQLNSFSR